MASDSVHNNCEQSLVPSFGGGHTHQDTAFLEDTVCPLPLARTGSEAVIPPSGVSGEVSPIPVVVLGDCDQKKAPRISSSKKESLRFDRNRVPLKSLDENVTPNQKSVALENDLIMTMMKQKNSEPALRELSPQYSVDGVSSAGPEDVEKDNSEFAFGTRKPEETNTEDTEFNLGTVKLEEIAMCNSDMSWTRNPEDTDSRNNGDSGATGQEDINTESKDCGATELHDKEDVSIDCIIGHVEMMSKYQNRNVEDVETTVRIEQNYELIDVARENTRTEEYNELSLPQNVLFHSPITVSNCDQNNCDQCKQNPEEEQQFVDLTEKDDAMKEVSSGNILSSNVMAFVSTPTFVGVDTNAMTFDDEVQVCNTSNTFEPQSVDDVCVEETDVVDSSGKGVKLSDVEAEDPCSGGFNGVISEVTKHDADLVPCELSEMPDSNVTHFNGLCPKGDLQDSLADVVEAISDDTSHRTDSVVSQTDIGDVQKDPTDSLNSQADSTNSVDLQTKDSVDSKADSVDNKDFQRDPTDGVDLQTILTDYADFQTEPTDNVDYQTDPTDDAVLQKDPSDSASSQGNLEHIGLPFEKSDNSADAGDQPAEPLGPVELTMEDAEIETANPVDDQSVADSGTKTGTKAVSARAKKRKKQKAKLEKYLAKYSAPRENRRRKYAESFKELLPGPEDDFHPDFTCPVCLDLFHRPHIVSPCQHMFCEPCLRKLPSSALADNAVCPLCRCDIRVCSLDVDLHMQLSTYYSYLYNKRARQEKKLRTNQNPLPRLQTMPLSQQIIRQIFRNSQSQRRNQTNGCLIFLAVCMSAVLAVFYIWLNIPIEITTGPLRNAAVSNIWIQAMCLFVILSWLFTKLLQTFADGTPR